MYLIYLTTYHLQLYKELYPSYPSNSPLIYIIALTPYYLFHTYSYYHTTPNC